MTRITDVGTQRACTLGFLLLLGVAVAGCTPSMVIGPLSHQQEEREDLLTRARVAGQATDVIEKVTPPLTPDEQHRAKVQDESCRASYMWKDSLTYVGGGLVAVAAGLTVGGAYANGSADTTKQIFGVTGASTALFGTMLVAIGGMIQNHYVNRGCVTRVDTQ